MKGKRLFVPVILAFFMLGGCSAVKKEVRIKGDVSQKEEKPVLVFPVFTMPMEKSKNLSWPKYDTLFLKGAKARFEQVIPVPKKVINNIPGSYQALDVMREAINTSSTLKPTENPKVKKFVDTLAEKMDGGDLLLAWVYPPKSGFKSSPLLMAEFGYFDTNTFQWRWLTDASANVSSFRSVPLPLPEPPYSTLVTDLIRDSFAKYDDAKSKDQEAN